MASSSLLLAPTETEPIGFRVSEDGERVSGIVMERARPPVARPVCKLFDSSNGKELRDLGDGTETFLTGIPGKNGPYLTRSGSKNVNVIHDNQGMVVVRPPGNPIGAALSASGRRLALVCEVVGLHTLAVWTVGLADPICSIDLPDTAGHRAVCWALD